MTARESLTVRIKDNFNASTIVSAYICKNFIYKLTFLNAVASHFSRFRWLVFNEDES